MLGERDGEWQKATGVCVSYFTVAFVAGIIVIVIMDVTLLFLRMEKGIRTIGGMKRRVVARSTLPKTGSNSSMKV